MPRTPLGGYRRRCLLPRYTYVCGDGHVADDLRRGLDVDTIECPTCRALAVRLPFYKNQYIQGETVSVQVPAADGRYRVMDFEKTLWKEAQARAKKHRGERARA